MPLPCGAAWNAGSASATAECRCSRAKWSNAISPGSFVVLHRTTDEGEVRILAAEHAKPKKPDHDARHSLPG